LGSDFIQQKQLGTPAEFKEANVALRTTVKEEALQNRLILLPLDLVL
jgi:hypothetical protein